VFSVHKSDINVQLYTSTPDQISTNISSLTVVIVSIDSWNFE